MDERIRLRNMPGISKEFSLHRPKLGPKTTSRKFGDDEDDRDRADDAVYHGLPMPHEEDDPTLKESDLAEIVDAFSSALVWAGKAQSVIEMGWRLATMLHVMRPVLIEGMALEIRRRDAEELRAAMGKSRLIALVGDHYRRALAFCRRCKDLRTLGQRGFAMIYLIKPAAIGGATNAGIGELDQRTRQAVNRQIGEARDSLDGFRNEMMRREETRKQCRQSRLQQSKA